MGVVDGHPVAGAAGGPLDEKHAEHSARQLREREARHKDADGKRLRPHRRERRGRFGAGVAGRALVLCQRCMSRKSSALPQSACCAPSSRFAKISGATPSATQTHTTPRSPSAHPAKYVRLVPPVPPRRRSTSAPASRFPANDRRAQDFAHHARPERNVAKGGAHRARRRRRWRGGRPSRRPATSRPRAAWPRATPETRPARRRDSQVRARQPHWSSDGGMRCG